MSQTGKIFVSCALGAFIGALIALQINHNFWWAGLVVGFVAGYLTYEIKTVAAAATTAWKTVIVRRPNGEWWAERYRRGMDLAGDMLTIELPFMVLFFCLAVRLSYWHRVLFLITMMVTVVTTCVVIALLRGANMRLETWGLNPLRIYVWTIPKFLLWTVSIKGTILLIRFVCGAAPKVGAGTWRLTTTLIRLIHSEIRLLCGTDAAIGAVIGYFFHNPLVGALAGGIFGVLNFEVLSIRLLRLVPREQSLFH